MMNEIEIVLADDHPTFLAGIRSALEDEPDLVIVGEAETGEQALSLTRTLQPNVLILDMDLPGISGVEVAKVLREDGFQGNILPLSGYSDPEYVFGVLENGASGYVTKNEPIAVIVKAVRNVAYGGVHISSKVAFEIIDERRRQYKKKKEPQDVTAEFLKIGITPTQLSVLKYVAEGFNNHKIAQLLNRSEHTIRNHIAALRNITGVRWRPELVAWAWQRGIMDIENNFKIGSRAFQENGS